MYSNQFELATTHHFDCHTILFQSTSIYSLIIDQIHHFVSGKFLYQQEIVITIKISYCDGTMVYLQYNTLST